MIPRRAQVSWWLGLVLALGFAALVTPAITAERWLLRDGAGTVTEHQPAPFTVRAPMTGYGNLRIGGGVVVARGEIASREEAALSDAIAAATPRGPALYLAVFALGFVLAALFTHHMRRSTQGRLARVQIVSLAVIAVLAVAVKIVLLSTALSALVVPLAVLAMVPTMVLDRIVGLATGVLAALVVSLLAPFDIGLALLLLVQTAAAGLVVTEGTRRRWLPALIAGGVTTLCTGATYLLVTYLTTGHAPELRDPLHSPWVAAAAGPALAAVLAAPLVPIYQLLVGEITLGVLIALEDLGHPLLRQIAEKSPGTWQHSLMMANMAEIAANAIGANGRLVRVGAYFHDLGKSLQPKYFIENLEAGETSPHDLLPPEVSCDAIFAHVTEGIVTARKAGLHERIVDFMHMHHGNGVLEYFWAKCREQGNPRGLTIEQFRYPGHPPQSRETALLAICDAVEAASRTLTRPDAAAIDALVQRIVYGKLHLGQLDDSGLSMSDLRRISDSLRETIRHANHGRIEYPWQKAGQDASASGPAYTTTAPRLDSLDRKPDRDSARHRAPAPEADALAATDDLQRPGRRPRTASAELGDAAPLPASESPGGSGGSAPGGRVRAGTARNAQTGDGPLAREPEPPRRTPQDELVGELARGASATTLPGRAAGPAIPADDPRSSRPADRGPATSTPAPEPSPGPSATLPGRAGSPSAEADAGVARAFERSAPIDPTGEDPRPAGSAVGVPTPRDTASPTAVPAAAPPPDAAGPASDAERGLDAAAPPPRRDPAETLPGRAPAPVARPEPPEPLATAEPPASPRAVPPPPRPRPPTPGGELVDLAPDRAAPSPPILRREPTAPPASPSDPAQLATALADLAARVRAAPFGKAGGSISDAAVAQPALAQAARDADADAAVTQPALAQGQAARGEDAEVAIAPPALPGPAGLPGPAAPPASAASASPAPPGDPGGHLPRPAGKARSSGLAAGGSRSILLQTLRGHVDEAKALRRPATVAPAEDDRVTVPRAAAAPSAGDPPRTAAPPPPAAHELDASVTEPSLPVLAVGDQTRFDVPLHAAPAPSPPAAGRTGWAEGLAARIDAALDAGSWGKETPIVPPREAELRALLGQPDPTKPQPIAELERLQRRAAELGGPELPRRSPHPTTEVDPDDIEAAIEVAPPARRPAHPNAIPRPRKPE